MIRNVKIEDAHDIAAIYNHYISDTTITFEIEPVSDETMKSRIIDISADYLFIVYESDGRVIGYCYVHQWKERAAYKGVVELSVYLSSEWIGRGIGTQLVERMIQECRKMKYRAVIACITEGNEASKAFHLKLGFEPVGHFKDVGLKFDRLLDILYYELIL